VLARKKDGLKRGNKTSYRKTFHDILVRGPRWRQEKKQKGRTKKKKESRKCEKRVTHPHRQKLAELGPPSALKGKVFWGKGKPSRVKNEILTQTRTISSSRLCASLVERGFRPRGGRQAASPAVPGRKGGQTTRCQAARGKTVWSPAEKIIRGKRWSTNTQPKSCAKCDLSNL